MIDLIEQISLEKEIAYLQQLIHKGGPNIEDYQELDKWHQQIWNNFKDDEQALRKIRSAFGDIYTDARGIFGHIFLAPHGYKGDFEIIDRVYRKQISSIPHLHNWDKYFLMYLRGPQAVRNRKAYFKNLLAQKMKINAPVDVLNLASGPCRDLKEFYEAHPKASLYFDCIDLDKKAIHFAKALTQNHPNINFIQQNIFRFTTDKQYDLIWSAGLFDYFNDTIFIRILKRILKYVKKNGELIIGNFHPRHSSRSVLEIADWYLHHRTEEDLIQLAQSAGIEDVNRITIEQEEEGINLFMRIRF